MVEWLCIHATFQVPPSHAKIRGNLGCRVAQNDCSHMGQLLTKLLDTSSCLRHQAGRWRLRPNRQAQTLIDEFNKLVRKAANHAGDDFVVFPMSDGLHGYSQMFVMPLDDPSEAR